MLKTVFKYTKTSFAQFASGFIALIYTTALNCFLSQFYRSRKLKTGFVK